MTLEHEVKFALPSFVPLRTALVNLGAVLRGRGLESNLVLDDRERSLTREGRLLRLRTDMKNTLTFKLPPRAGEAGADATGLKVMREIETEVADLAALAEIFAALGYEPVLRYEKIRETWLIGQPGQPGQSSQLAVCLDLLPFGRFAEIEGPPALIAPLAGRLGLSMDAALVQTYHELRRQAALEDGGAGPDFLFNPATRAQALTKTGLALLMEVAEIDPGQAKVDAR
ncbi:MAG: class IV adenylate cyclase [Desulfovibrionaceae bacterium]|nr:class IV adenylate cyclase [Desulfovibrionaceae bacterium]MBF0513697.1 class IV adenylate cyclase [Desulfovibrionaceae bacterium]